MKLEEIKVKIRCDVPNCRSFAEYKLKKDGFLKNAGMFLCKDCLMDIYKTLGVHVVPKSPNNMLNRKISTRKVKEENDNE